MAKVFGQSGRYVSDEATRKTNQIWQRVMFAMLVFGFIEGVFVARFLFDRQLSMVVRALIVLPVVPTAVLLSRWTDRKTTELDRQRMSLRRGAQGEDLVAKVLETFPEDFHVLNDLTTPFGNLDHVIIGPTGVFLLDTKAWRGTVAADGKGELLTNGKATDKPLVKQFVARIMGIRDKVRTLAPGLDPYYQAVFVFTSAKVEANWGTTGSVHCIRDDQLHEYILEKNFGKKLKPSEAQTLAQAFLGLAHMDADFTQKATPQSSRPALRS